MKRKQSQVEVVHSSATSFSSPYFENNACSILDCQEISYWKALLDAYPGVLESIDVKVKESGDKKFGFNHLETSLREMDDYLFRDLAYQLQDRLIETFGVGKTKKTSTVSTTNLSGAFLTKTELVKIIQWKMTRGKVRPYMKFILANTEANIKKISFDAFKIVDQIWMNIDRSNKEKHIASLRNEKTKSLMRQAIEKMSCKEMKGLRLRVCVSGCM